MAKGTFGEHLKREREMRAVSLDEISAATRIATRFLLAIENEQWDQLPGGVFNRGFVRAVARYLGLDEEDTVAEYAAAAGDGPSVPVWTGRPPAVAPEQPWLAWILIAAVALTLAMGGWFGLRRIIAWRASRHAAQATTASDAPSPEEGAPASGSADSSLPATADATAPVDAPLELKLEAGENTSVTVDADARRVFDGGMKAGDERTFTAQDQFLIEAHDAGALVLVLNGKTMAPMGPRGQVGKVTLTRESLQRVAGGGHQ